VELETFFWVLARVAGLVAMAALTIALASGIGLRSGVLDWLGNNRALRELHEYTAVLWMPLGGLHVLALVLDSAARIGPLDVVLPFLVPYGRLAIGLGTVSFDLVLLVAAAGWLRRRLGATAWQWLHRLSYPAFGLVFAHVLLAGTDAGQAPVAAAVWGVTALLAVLAVARARWGRLPP
jgi:sulfoxide reductase heme-binding subunit YedZ